MFSSNKTETGFYASSMLIFVASLYLTSFYSYLLFHSIIEFITIALAFTLLILTWNTRKYMTNSYLRLLGIGYAFISLLDLFHTLAYKGMNIFSDYDGSNLPTQLWIAARYLQAVTLLLAPLLLKRGLNNLFILVGYAATILALVTVIYAGKFPDAYIEGEGLTIFKIVSEYLIVFLLTLALFFFSQQRQYFNDRVFFLLALSIVFTIFSEISFTAYLSVYSSANLIGHFFKLAAFYLLYESLLVTGLQEPFNLIFKDLKQAESSLRIAHDTLEEKVRERTAELRESEERFRLMAENSTDMISRHTPDGTYSYVSPACLTLLGYQPEELVGHSAYDFIHPDDTAAVIQSHTTIINQPTVYTVDYRIRRQDNRYIWFETTSRTVHDKQSGALLEIQAASRDITERKRAEEALRASNRRLEMLFAQSLLAVIECNTELEIIAWNPAAEQLFACPKAEVLGQNYVNFTLPEASQPQVNQMLQTLLHGGGSQHRVNENKTKDGRIILCEWYDTALMDSNGQPIGIASIGLDITERRQIEEARHERDRLSATLEKERELNTIKNNIIRTVSHEFRTPLAVISTSSALLHRYYERLTPERRQGQLATIEEQVHKLDAMVEEIVSAVHNTSSDFAFHPAPANLEAIASLVVTELQSTIGAKHQMIFESEGHLQNLMIDEHLVNRILVNLLSNAIKYSSEGTSIRLHIAESEDKIMLQVSDQGIGISPEDQQQIFQPFFRASNVRTISGIGLGLSIVRDCVNLHQGTISFESAPNQGTSFTVCLPKQPTIMPKYKLN